MKTFLSDLFKGEDGRWSLKRICVVPGMLCIVAINIAWMKKAYSNGDFTQMESVLWADMTFVLALLGLVVWQGVSNMKISQNGTK